MSDVNADYERHDETWPRRAAHTVLMLSFRCHSGYLSNCAQGVAFRHVNLRLTPAREPSCTSSALEDIAM